MATVALELPASVRGSSDPGLHTVLNFRSLRMTKPRHVSDELPGPPKYPKQSCTPSLWAKDHCLGSLEVRDVQVVLRLSENLGSDSTAENAVFADLHPPSLHGLTQSPQVHTGLPNSLATERLQIQKKTEVLGPECYTYFCNGSDSIASDLGMLELSGLGIHILLDMMTPNCKAWCWAQANHKLHAALKKFTPMPSVAG